MNDFLGRPLKCGDRVLHVTNKKGSVDFEVCVVDKINNKTVVTPEGRRFTGNKCVVINRLGREADERVENLQKDLKRTYDELDMAFRLKSEAIFLLSTASRRVIWIFIPVKKDEYCIGFYAPSGEWKPIFTTDNMDKAIGYCHYLNGGS